MVEAVRVVSVVEAFGDACGEATLHSPGGSQKNLCDSAPLAVKGILCIRVAVRVTPPDCVV